MWAPMRTAWFRFLTAFKHAHSKAQLKCCTCHRSVGETSYRTRDSVKIKRLEKGAPRNSPAIPNEKSLLFLRIKYIPFGTEDNWYSVTNSFYADGYPKSVADFTPKGPKNETTNEIAAYTLSASQFYPQSTPDLRHESSVDFIINRRRFFFASLRHN